MNLRYVFFIFLAAVLVYLPGLPGGFIYDDYFNILNNKAVTESDLSASSAWEAMNSGVAGPLGRPLAMFSFYLNYKLSGLSALSFKLFNIAIHAVNALLVFLVSFRLLSVLAKRSKIIEGKQDLELLAFWITVLWAVHPINLTSVLYVVQRMTSMSAMFTLLGMYGYLQIRQDRSLAIGCMSVKLCAVVFLGLMAALCKEIGLMLFFYLFVIECFLFRWEVMREEERKCLYVFYVFTLAIPLCMVVYLLLFSNLLTNYENRLFDLPQRLLTESRAIWFYIGQILLPQAHLFSLYHDDFTLSKSLLEPLTTAVSIVGLIFIVLAGIIYTRRLPWFGFGIAFFLCGHAMESTIFPLVLVFEHRNYLPSLGLILILVLFIKIILGFFNRISSNLIFAVFMILFASVTASRAYDWHSIPLLAERLVQRHPNSVAANLEVGYAYRRLYEVERNPVIADISIKAFRKAYLLADESRRLEVAIALAHAASLFGETQDQALLDEINRVIRNSRIRTKDIVVLEQFAECKSNAMCDTEHEIYKKIFTNMLAKPNLKGRDYDDLLYIYSSYLVTVSGEEELALKFMREIVARNPENLTYKLKLISVLLTNEYMTEAYEMMDNLTKHYGTEWNIISE